MLDKDIPTGPHLQIADDFLKYTLLRLIPQSVTPNAVTTVRFICVPIVIYLLLSENYAWGAVVFALAALTDALDGAMARTRHQITHWGKVADPLADKLLISSTAILLVTHFIDVEIAAFIVGIELLLIARAIYRHMSGQNVGANAMGKIKMVIQSVALIILFLYAIVGIPFYLTLATWGLFLAIFFAVVSLFTEPAP
jgi:CDP-diacylglycerol--glycerol-3-phosphate 3-phosphatidyltransferase